MRIAWSGARRRLARLCVWLAIAGLVAAAARPSVAVEPTTRAGILELVIDVSGSTQADDLAPTRLGATQRATIRLLDRVPPRVQVGLVSFAGTARSLARPTTNRDTVRRRIAGLASLGGSAIGDALQRALEDIEASHPAGPVWILLISDGSDTAGRDPLEVARAANARHRPVQVVALGRPDATVTVPDEIGIPRRLPILPDLLQLNRIAAAAGGHAVAARSAPELETALDDLLRRADLDHEQRDLALPFATTALLLLALARALTPPRQRTAPGTRTRLPAAPRPWASPVALLVAAGVTLVAWTQWLPTDPTPAAGSVMVADLAAQPLAVPPASRPPATLAPTVTIAAIKADRTIVQQAARLLRAHGALATEPTAELTRRHLAPVALSVSACDVCVTRSLTSPGDTGSTIAGQAVCDVVLNTRFVRKQAQRAQVPVRMVATMALLHEQELCLRAAGSRTPPFATEQRLASRLHDPRLLDLLYAQIDAGQRDWSTVEQAVVILRDHGELAFQRRDEIGRRRLNQTGPLWISVCRGCREDIVGEAWPGSESDGLVGCEILLDLAGIERQARDWDLPVAQVTASVLVHEQEHCIRAPDDRETPAIDEERRLAGKVGSAQLLDYAVSFYSELDPSGHWKP